METQIFVLSTNFEALPISVLEAMRAGLPVVATNVGGIAELVHHGRTGLLVQRADVAGLRDSLARLIADPELRLSLGRAGRDLWEAEFTSDTMATRTVEVYNLALAPCPPDFERANLYMMIRRLQLWFVYVLIIGMLPLTAMMATPSTADSRLNELWWAARHDEKLRDPERKQANLLFLGDSITNNYELANSTPFLNYKPVWDHYFAGLGAFNLGFAGDTTANLLWRIKNGELDGLSPRVTVLLIGTNNTTTRHRNWSATQDASAIMTIIEYVHQRLPMTHIVLVGILPSGQSAWKDSMTSQINGLLESHYVGGKVPHVSYVDMTSIFVRDGKLNEKLFVESRSRPPEGAVHPTAEGQAAMAAALAPVIMKSLHMPAESLRADAAE